MLAQQIARLELAAVPVSGADHFRDAEMIGESKRSAAERCETGAENHSVIGVLRRRDDLFFQTTRRFVHHEKNQTESEIVLAVIPSGAKEPRDLCFGDPSLRSG